MSATSPADAAATPLVLESTADGVRTLCFNRPQALNSLTRTMLGELADALTHAAEDRAVRCVVITGAGRAFCAGQDLSDPGVAADPRPGAPPKDLGQHIANAYRPVLLRLRQMPVPVLAAVNGVAAGAGASIALGCDLVIATRSASFIQAFSKIGLIPDSGGTWLLPRLVGRARALGLAMLGNKLGADEAAQWGLIWQSVADDEWQAAVNTTALQLARMPTAALVRARALIDQNATAHWSVAIDAETAAQRELGVAHDYQEGVSAFMQKRAPQFSDR